MGELSIRKREVRVFLATFSSVQLTPAQKLNVLIPVRRWASIRFLPGMRSMHADAWPTSPLVQKIPRLIIPDARTAVRRSIPKILSHFFRCPLLLRPPRTMPPSKEEEDGEAPPASGGSALKVSTISWAGVMWSCVRETTTEVVLLQGLPWSSFQPCPCPCPRRCSQQQL